MKMGTKRLWWQDDGIWWCVDYLEMPDNLQVALQIVSDPYVANGGGK